MLLNALSRTYATRDVIDQVIVFSARARKLASTAPVSYYSWPEFADDHLDAN
jgi:hypothetical protein